MLCMITQLDKFAAFQRVFLHNCMLVGSPSTHFAQLLGEGNDTNRDGDGSEGIRDDEEDKEDEEVDSQEKPSVNEHLKDAGPVAGPQALSSIALAVKSGMSLMCTTTTVGFFSPIH